MKKLWLIFFTTTIIVNACKKSETNNDTKSSNSTNSVEIKGIWATKNLINDLKFIEIKDKYLVSYFETSSSIKTVETDTLLLTDSSIVIPSISAQAQKLIKNPNGTISVEGLVFEKSEIVPEDHWFKPIEIELDRSDVISNNRLGIGTFGNQLLMCRPDADYYDLYNTSNFAKAEKWMKGTVPSVIDADEDLVYASSKSGYSLYIHLSIGGMAYEEIGGMGALNGICKQPGTPYVWLYSANDTLYKYHINTLKIISKTKLNASGAGDICWHNNKILIIKKSSIIEYDVNTKTYGNHYWVKGVNTMYGIASVEGKVWLTADGNRLIKIKAL